MMNQPVAEVVETPDEVAALEASHAFLAHMAELHEGEKVRKCIQCGTCAGVCPHGSEMDYAPRKLIAALRAGRIDEVLASDTIWLCVTCQNCAHRCPSGIGLVDRLIPAIREEFLLQGAGVPGELQTAFERTSRYGNPFGDSPRKREKWAKAGELEVPVLKKGMEAEVLWFVECFPAFHPRNQSATRDFARILQALDVDFGTLGKEEWCSGDTRRLGGEQGLFEMMFEHNVAALDQRGFKEIVTTDPHAYNALLNEYPLLGARYEVRHATQFLVERLKTLQPLLTTSLDLTVTFHDPCYLGRRNGEYEAPRELLEALPGLKLIEMDRNRENALCCGGGGGGVWLDSFIWEHTSVPLPVQRVQEAFRTGAQALVVACPLEVSRFEDAIKTADLEGDLAVMEITELVARAMGLGGGE